MFRNVRLGTLGLTMVELLAAMAVTGIVMAAAVSIFSAQQRNFVRDRNIKEISQDAQDVLRYLKGDLMEAGFSTRSSMAFYLADGGSTRSDKIYINDTSVLDIQPPGEWADPAELPDAMQRFIGNQCPGCVTILSGSGTSTVVVDTLNISESGNDFLGGIYQFVISDAGTNKVAKINSISGNQLLLAESLSGTLLAPAVYYCVDDGNLDCHPTTANAEQWVLRRSDRGSGGRQAMVENVMDLQVVYEDSGGFRYGEQGCVGTGVGNGFCERNPFDSSEVRLIRLFLVVRGKNQDRRRIGDPSTCRPPAGNRPGTNMADAAQRNVECGHVYRVYEVVLQPRNAG